MQTAELFRRMGLKRRSPVALYHQVRQGIASLIRDGDLSPGEQLPAVVDGARFCGVSKATFGRALDELSRDGMLTSKRGMGVYVADIIAPPGIEVLVPMHDPDTQLRASDFHQLVADGVASEFDGNVRAFVTYTDARHAVAHEILGVARIRGAVGLVAYRPDAAMLPALREVARQLPTVSLSVPIPDAPSDVIGVNVAGPVEALLRERVRNGQKHLVFAGLRGEDERTVAPPSAPAQMIDAVRRVAEENGLTPIVHFFGSPAEMMAQSADFGAGVPKGATVLCAPPGAFPPVARAGRDVIAYTESPDSLGVLTEGGTSVCYAGIDTWARCAARMLRRRIEAPAPPPSATERITAVIHDVRHEERR